MDFTLLNLLPTDQQLRTVQLHETVSDAIDIMCQNGYGQLPLRAPDGSFLGKVITFESIILAMQSCQTGSGSFLVSDAARRVRSYPSDADLLTTLEDIHRDNFALIVDEAMLKGIVTTADAATFFREYAEDLMLIEGIESGLKDAIRTLYAGDEVGLDTAIATVADRAADIRRRLPGAIKAFLAKENGQAPVVLNPGALAEAEKKLALPKPAGKLEDMALNDLIEILLLHEKAPRLSQSPDVGEIRRLLQRVRDGRNKLAHFRGELTPEERRTIKFAAEWLENNLPEPLPEPPTSHPSPVLTPQLLERQEAMDEEIEGPLGSYGPLAIELRGLPPDISSMLFTFQQIEDILKKELPRSALEYRAWWSNDPMKPQSAAWLDEGWRTTSVNMAEQRLIFVRTNDREEAYIRFFAKLNARLGAESDFPLRGSSPQGQSWQILTSLDRLRPDSATIIASFARRKRFRIELYLDLGERDENKHRFDQLVARRGEIEQIFGEPLEWERMDNRRACRIAIYTKAQLLTDADYPTLLEWAAKRTKYLYMAFKSEFV